VIRIGVLNYRRTGDIIEINIRSFNGSKIESHTCDAKDKKKYSSILRYLKDKYGFEPEIDVNDSINNKEKAKDVDWLGWSN